MATAHDPAVATSLYVSPIDPKELRRRNAEMIAILREWATEGDEQDQREAMDVLREALGPARVMSGRAQFP